MFEHTIEGCQCKGKACTKCNKFLCFGSFHKNQNRRDGLKGACKDCVRPISRAWREANREHNRQHKRAYDKATRRKLYRKYNLTAEKWDAILKAQDGLCAICHKTLQRGKDAHVDHCHITGRIRGILCAKCNNGLGFFGDNADNLQRAYQYLIKE